jgi:hypothetical protein
MPRAGQVPRSESALRTVPALPAERATAPTFTPGCRYVRSAGRAARRGTWVGHTPTSVIVRPHLAAAHDDAPAVPGPCCTPS